MADYDILVPGELNPDIILSGGDVMPRFGQYELLVDDIQLTIGSSSAIFACAAARLGLRVAFVGIVGDDLFGRFMLDALSERGVDVSFVHSDPGLRTGVSIILSRTTDRAILTFAGTIGALTADRIPLTLLENCRAIHISSYFLQKALQPGLPDFFRRAKQLNRLISLDTNWDPEERWNANLKRVYPYVDILMPNEREAAHLGRAQNWYQGARALAAQHMQVVVKRGAQGAALVSENTSIEVKAFPTTVIDTTGAGDNFNAGYLYGYLQNWSAESCLKMGLACGAISVQAVGGTGKQATLHEALEIANL